MRARLLSITPNASHVLPDSSNSFNWFIIANEQPIARVASVPGLPVEPLQDAKVLQLESCSLVERLRSTIEASPRLEKETCERPSHLLVPQTSSLTACMLTSMEIQKQCRLEYLIGWLG